MIIKGSRTKISGRPRIAKSSDAMVARRQPSSFFCSPAACPPGTTAAAALRLPASRSWYILLSDAGNCCGAGAALDAPAGSCSEGALVALATPACWGAGLRAAGFFGGDAAYGMGSCVRDGGGRRFVSSDSSTCKLATSNDTAVLDDDRHQSTHSRFRRRVGAGPQPHRAPDSTILLSALLCAHLQSLGRIGWRHLYAGAPGRHPILVLRMAGSAQGSCQTQWPH